MGDPRENLEKLSMHPGLCATCRFLKWAESPRSVFVRCGKAEEDATLVKYPAIPVQRCHGYEQ